MTTPTSTVVDELPASVPEAPPDLEGLIVLPAELGPISDEQLEQIGQANPGWLFELNRAGGLVINVYAGDESSDATLELGAQIRNWKVGGGGGRARESSGGNRTAGLSSPGPVMQPDVAWISDERLDAASIEELSGALALPPDFVVEVMSPKDRFSQQHGKMLTWLREGVRLGWLLDLKAQEVWVYRPEQEPERFERPELISGEDVMPGLEVDFSEIWRLVDRLEARRKAASEETEE